MKKTILQRFFLSLCLMIVGCLWGSAAWAAPGDVFYTLECLYSSSNTAYDKYNDVTINGLTWNAPGNQKFTGYWRIGGSSLNKVDRIITGKSAINSAISKVTLAHKGRSNTSAKINSVSLTVASDANFTDVIETVTIKSPSLSKGVAGTMDFTPTSGNWPTGSYYKLTINVTNTTTSNAGLDITSLTFYEGAEAPAKTLSSVTVTGNPTKTTYEAGDAFEPAGLVVTGTYSDGSDAPITEGITWNVTPATLTEGLTSVDVTATVDGVTSAEYTVEGLTVTAARTLASVTLEGNPTKTTYYVGETFDPTGIRVMANYTTGDPEDVTDEAIFTYDDAALTIGTTYAEVFATYNEMDSDVEKYDITVNKKASSISIANLTIGVGDISTITATTTPADAALTYTITDGNEYVTLEGNQITGSAVGTATIKASYAGDDEYEAAETSFTVTVSDLKTATISSFSTTSGNFTNNTDISFEAFKGGASTAPGNYNNALRLYQGSPGGYVTISGVSGVNIQSITLYTSSTYASTTVGYSVDGGAAPTSGKSVAENSSYTIDGLNNQSVSIYCLGTTKDTRLEIAKIVVKYTKENITLSSIALSGDYQTEFSQYDIFNHENLVVTATYSNGSTSDVTSLANFSTPDMTTIGEKTVTVSYTENEVTKEATYDITVNKKIFSQIEPITAYRKITSTAEIVDGGQYVIVYTAGKKGLLAGASNIHNATPADVIFEGNGTISTANAAAMTEITFEKYSTNTYYLKIGDNKYIKATSGETYLNVATGKDEYTPWVIAFDAAGNVEITSKKIDNRGIMYSTNSTGYFKNYDVSKRGQAGYHAIQLYQKVGEMPIAKATGYVSTYVADFAYVMPKHITGHTVTLAAEQGIISTEKVFHAGDEVPALTPLLIKSDEDYAETSKNYNPAVLNKTVDAYKGDNMLEYRRTAQGLTNTMKDESVYYYKLAIKSGNVGFYWGAENGAAFTMTKPSTAYLTVPQSISVQGFVLNLEEGETTGIATVVTNEDAPIYNLQGIRMNGKNLPKGIYIQGGKKFMVK